MGPCRVDSCCDRVLGFAAEFSDGKVRAVESWEIEHQINEAQRKAREAESKQLSDYHQQQQAQRQANRPLKSGGSGHASASGGRLGLLILGALVVASLLFSLNRGINNLRATEVMDHYGTSWYIGNFLHAHETALLQVSKGPLPCYPASADGPPTDRGAVEPSLSLRSGQGFIFAGYQNEDDHSWVAAELYRGDEKVRCFLLLDEPPGDDPLPRRDASSLVTHYDLRPLHIRQHARFRRLAKREPSLVGLRKGDRRMRKKYDRSKTHTRVTAMMSPPRAENERRGPAWTPRPHYIANDKVAWLNELYRKHLSQEVLWRLASRL